MEAILTFCVSCGWCIPRPEFTFFHALSFLSTLKMIIFPEDLVDVPVVLRMSQCSPFILETSGIGFRLSGFAPSALPTEPSCPPSSHLWIEPVD